MERVHTLCDHKSKHKTMFKANLNNTSSKDKNKRVKNNLPSVINLMIILAMFWTFLIAKSAEASGSIHKSANLLG